MKKLLYFLTLGLSSLLFFAACSDDDNENFSSDDIVGKWLETREYGVDEDGDFEYTPDPSYRDYLVFNSDGTMNDIEEVNGVVVSNDPFSWELSGNKLIATDGYETRSITIKQLTETTLTLSFEAGPYWSAADYVRVSE